MDERDVLFFGGDLDNSEDEDETFAFSAIREMAEGGIRRPPGGAGDLYVSLRVTDGPNVRIERYALDLSDAGRTRFADAVGSAVARVARQLYAQGLAPRVLGVFRGTLAPSDAVEVESGPGGEPEEPEEPEESEAPEPLPPPSPPPPPAPPPAPAPRRPPTVGERVGAGVDAVLGAVGKAARAIGRLFGFGR